MNLDQQIQDLIDQAPQDGKTPGAVQAIAPLLQQIAKRLQHTQYYVVQTPDQSWVVTTLSNQTQPELEKNVIYAFSSREDALTSFNAPPDPQLEALPIAVIQLLFQTMTLNTVDSIVFFDSASTESGTEINCQEIRDLIQAQLHQTLKDRLPPDVA